MNQSNHPSTDTDPPGIDPGSPRDGIWAGLTVFGFVASMALAYRPRLDSTVNIARSVLPWAVLAGLALAWSGRSFTARLAGIAIAIGGWSILLTEDDRWTTLSFSLYGLCFIVDSTRLHLGVTLSGVVSAVWLIASLDGPTWTLVIPVFVFVGSSTIAYAIDRIGRLSASQAALIEQLEATRAHLATSERSRGVLEERTRMAGEIHDTLAQGFTSIVLLARAGRRATTNTEEALASIETTAQENLHTARRLVESSRPDELAEVSLPDALRRHVREVLPDHIDGELEVVGTAYALPGSVETVLLRAAQEGIRNACSHAQPGRVDLTLSYCDDLVTLAVRDDGIGIDTGEVRDRGTLTGGQGLATLTRRVESLDGRVTIEPDDHGTLLTVEVPVEP